MHQMNTIQGGILGQLSSLQSQFLLALQSGSDALLSFHQTWRTFNAQVESCIDQLPEETISEIHSFAQSASVIATMLIEVDTASENLQHQLGTDIATIIHEEFKDLSLNDKPNTHGSAAYIPRASSWLLKNLHNPYPSKEVRQEISASTHSPLKDVDAWFIQARTRIGWNKLRKDHFRKRSDLVTRATRFFKPSHSISLKSLEPVSTDNDFAIHFAQIEARAQELYSDKLFPSCLASDLAHTLRPKQQSNASDAEEQSYTVQDGASSYPSPASSSRSSSPLPHRPGPSELLTSRKRQRSIYSITQDDDTFPAKRSRLDEPEVRDEIAANSLPSPATSTSALDEFQHSTTVLQPVERQVIVKRKRSMSDADDRVIKRPINSLTLRAVSSPAVTYALDATDPSLEGLNQPISFDMPAPVANPYFDESLQFEIDFYNYDFAINSMPSGSYDSDSTADSPELADNVTLPQLQTSPLFWDSGLPVSDANVPLVNDVPSTWSFDMASIPAEPPCSEDMSSSHWLEACIPNEMSNTTWDYLTLNNPTSNILNSTFPTTGEETLYPLSQYTPTQLTYVDKCLKMNQLQKILAQAAILRSELEL